MTGFYIHLVVFLLINAHHSLYAPADFDLSPFFEIVKPRCLAPQVPGEPAAERST
jgi:hypothetical protein